MRKRPALDDEASERQVEVFGVEARAEGARIALRRRRRAGFWADVERWRPWVPLPAPEGTRSAQVMWHAALCMVNGPFILLQAMWAFAFRDHRRLLDAIFTIASVLGFLAVACNGVAAFVEPSSSGARGPMIKPTLKVLGDTPYTFSACDCTAPGVRYVDMDLTETEPCIKEEGDFEEPYDQRVIVLQTDGHDLVDVVNCEVRYTKEIITCGVTSQNYGSLHVERDRILYVSKEDCLKMADEGSYTGEGDQSILGGFPYIHLKEGVWGWDTFFSKGGRDGAGNCIWDSWLYQGQHYNKAYEETTVRARMRKFKGSVNRKTGILTIPMVGLQTTYTETYVEDVEGVYVWELKKENCTGQLSQIYDEYAVVHRVREEKRKSSDKFDNAVLTFTNQETQQSGGFVVSKERDSCLPDCHRTHIAGIITCLDPHRVRDKIEYRPGKDTSIKMLQSAMSHLQLTNTFKVNGKFTDVSYDGCVTRQFGTEHQLADLAGNDNAYALRNIRIDGLGQQCRQFLPGGAAGYVASCPTVNVTMVPYPNCTVEIPVVHAAEVSNHSAIVKFVDPISMVLQDVPTVSVCSVSMPIKWKINSIWYCSTPVTHECDSPHKLSTTLGSTGLATTPSDFPGLGNLIYSPEQRLKNQEFMSQKVNRRPIDEHQRQNTLKNTKPGLRGEPVRFGLPFNADELDSLSMQMALRIMPLFALLGQSYNIVIGILFCLGVLKLLIGCGLRIGVLYKRKGFGVWLLTACWSTLFTLFGLPWKVAKTTYNSTMADLEHAMQDLEPKTYAQLSKHLRGIVKAQEAQHNANLHRDETIRALVSGIAKHKGPFQAVAVKVLEDMERTPPRLDGPPLRSADEGNGDTDGAANNGDDTTDTLLP